MNDDIQLYLIRIKAIRREGIGPALDSQTVGKILFATNLESNPTPWKLAANLLKDSGFEVLDLNSPGGYVDAGTGHRPTGLEPDIVTAKSSLYLAKFIAEPEFHNILRTAVIMMRREDPLGLIRELDLESKVVTQIFKSICFLAQHQPDLVVFSITPHFFGDYLLQKSAEALGIRSLWFQPSSMAPMMLPRDANGLIKLRLRGRTFSAISEASISKTLETSLNRFSRLEVPNYIQKQRFTASRSTTFLGKIRALRTSVRWLFTGRFPARTLHHIGVRIPATLLKYLQISIPRQRLSSLQKSAHTHQLGALPSKHWVLFALHYEPERTFVPEGGEDRSQLIQIAKIRELIGSGPPIIVREHSSQLSPSLQGYLGRSPGFYPAVKKLPGVEIDNSSSLDVLLDGASWVVTATGNIGIEAALRGVPVLHFGKPWWEGMPGSHHFDDAKANPKILLKPERVDRKVVTDFLRKRIMEEMIPGGGSETFEELKQRFPLFVEDVLADSGKFLCNFLASEINSGSPGESG